jgi:DNA-binding CsgD family transcriptional regulator
MSAPQIDDDDVRAMVRLIGETCALKGNLTQRRRHLMTGLCRLLRADAWAWAQAAEMNPARLPVYVGITHGGFTEEKFARFLKVQTHPDMIWMTAPVSQEIQDTKRHVTRSLQHIVPIPEFMKAEVSGLWRESGVYPILVSFYPQPDGIISAIGIYRQCGREWATDREVRIAHILMAELAWLHVHESPETVLSGVPRLSVRQRLALELLLHGHSRKSIAENMQISINTVSGYIRDIYRFFQVSSQPQLVRRFFRGDGGDGL